MFVANEYEQLMRIFFNASAIQYKHSKPLVVRCSQAKLCQISYDQKRHYLCAVLYGSSTRTYNVPVHVYIEWGHMARLNIQNFMQITTDK